MKRNVVLGLMIIVLTSFMAWKVYAAYTTTFTNLLVQNLVIFRFQPERENPEDPLPPMEIGLGINVVLTNAGGERLGHTKKFDLTAPQKTAITNFVIPFVQALGTELDVTVPPWAQP